MSKVIRTIGIALFLIILFGSLAFLYLNTCMIMGGGNAITP